MKLSTPQGEKRNWSKLLQKALASIRKVSAEKELRSTLPILRLKPSDRRDYFGIDHVIQDIVLGKDTIGCLFSTHDRRIDILTLVIKIGRDTMRVPFVELRRADYDSYVTQVMETIARMTELSFIYEGKIYR